MNTSLQELGATLRHQQEEIMQEWLKALLSERRITSASALDNEGLRDHVAQLLDDLSDQLCTSASLKSEASALRHAEIHGDARWTQKFQLHELLREIALLRTVVVDRVVDYFTGLNDASAEANLGHKIVHRFFDAVLVDSASLFARRQQAAATDTEHELQTANDALQAKNEEYEQISTERLQGLFLAETHAQRWAFLAEASALLSSSLDYETTLRNVAQLSVPAIADWCAIDFLQEDGSIEALAVAHSDPDKLELAHEYRRRYPVDPEQPHGVGNVLRTGQAELYPTIAPELLKSAARSEEHFRFMQELGMCSAMVVPLAANGRTFGAITFVSAESGRTFGEEDLILAKSLGTRAALSVENARLFHETQERQRALERETRERERASVALEETETDFRALFELAAVGMTQADSTTGRLLRVNRKMCEMLGYSEQELLQMSFRQFTHPDDRERDFAAFQAVVRGEAPLYTSEKRYVRKDGSMIWGIVTAHIVRDAKGRPLHSLAAVLDITERKKAEEKLHYQLELTRSITDNAAESIFMMDNAGRVTFVNPEAERTFGFSAQELIGQVLHNMLHHHHPDGRPFPIHECQLGRVFLQGAETLRNHEDLFFCRDGSKVDVICSNAPIFVNGKVTGAVLVVHDVTRQKQAERALREADRRKNEFLAMLAHELRNPLAAIRNALQVGEVSSANMEDIGWASRVVDRQSVHLGRLVDDLLDVSRITSGKIRLHKEQINAVRVLDHAVEAVRPLMNERRHEMILAYDRSAELPLEADATRLEQIVVNLLTNAAKYTEAGGRVWLKAQREGEDIVITIQDTGVGIPPEKLPEMFELFTQGERSIARSEGGLGLGLTIVRSLTEMHGGKVIARSRGLGTGSEFTVCLPAVAKASDSAPRENQEEVSSSSGTAGQEVRVLVVDDNMDTAEGLARLLERRGYAVYVAHDGAAAISLARTTNPQAILLDIGLPGMNGYQVAFKLREEECGKEALIIAISGYGQEEDIRRSKEAGFDHHLVKPMDFEQLKALLSRVAPGPVSGA